MFSITTILKGSPYGLLKAFKTAYIYSDAFSLTIDTVSLQSLNEIGTIYLKTVSGGKILVIYSIWLAINSLILHYLGSF